MSRDGTQIPGLPGERFLDVEGQQLRVAIRRGEETRTPLLLFNGIGAPLELLQPLVEAIDPRFELIRVDVPGVGRSPMPRRPYRFSTLSCLIGRMLDRLGYEQVDVFGVSWGGGLAQQFALQNPRRCRRLILCATATGTIMVPGKPWVLWKLGTPRRYVDEAYRAEIAAEIYGGSLRTRLRRGEINRFLRQLETVDARGYRLQLLCGLGWTSLPWLPLLRQWTLIIAGNDDPLVPLINARIMNRLIPRARLSVIAGGHIEVLVHPKLFASMIESFLIEPKVSIP